MRGVFAALLLTAACAGPEIENLFCEDCGSSCGEDDDPRCPDGAGGEAGGGGKSEPPPCECDDGNPCNGFETCAGDGSCVTTGDPEPVDDGDECTYDLCENGLPVHPEKPLDDGNPCTNDFCVPETGILHWGQEVCEP